MARLALPSTPPRPHHPAPLRTMCGLLALAALVTAPGLAVAQAEPSTPPPLLEPLAHGRTLDLPTLDPSVPSPAEILGASLGARFTHHARILDYLERLAADSPRVTLWRYGETYEGRPLTLVAVSAPGNIARLEEIRSAHLKLADPRGLVDDARERLLTETPVVVWLAYGVHGNESSSAEAAMAAAYVLAAAGGEWEELLADTIVIIDPLVNPDGRERYVGTFEQRRGRTPDAAPSAAEHWEPWPGGRQNHYLIDLNRDWAWASQTETRARLAAYRRWEPQVFVDYHEMFAESSYFFPPAADPVNPYLDRRTVGWLEVFGRANAAAFDRQGWPYFKAESFDLFYPGYGDAYPAFRGAVGMTYEMAGHGRAGLVMELRDGTRLTLSDRIARHTTTSLSTVRTAAEHRRALLEDFTASRADAAALRGPAFLWSADAPEAVTLAELLGRHGIEVGRLASSTRLPVRALKADPATRPAERTFPAGTYVVRAGQPLGNLVQTLLGRAARIDDAYLERQRDRLERNVGTEFYDITAWSLPLAFNLETWVAPEPPADLSRRLGGPSVEAAGLAVAVDGDSTASMESRLGESRPGVGFLVRPSGIDGYRFASALIRDGLDFRVALRSFALDGEDYPAGTLFIPRLGNEEKEEKEEKEERVARRGAKLGGELDRMIDRLGREAGATVRWAPTFYTSRGVSLGSDLVPNVAPPRVGILSGSGTSPTSFGYLWHLLDQQVELPHSRIDLERLGAVDLESFDTLILPEGWGYGDALGDTAGDEIVRWVHDGGVLVAVGSAHRWLRERELTAVERWEPDKEDGDGDALAGRAIQTPGAIVATELETEHPLGLGVQSAPPVLVTGATVLLPTGDPQVDVLKVVDESPILAGVAWPEAVDRLSGSLLASVERQGRGLVVLFAQEPDFRLFWRGTAPLFLNAVVYGPTLAGGGRY